MDIKEFHKQITEELLPYSANPDKDFRDRLRTALRSYLEKIKDLTIDGRKVDQDALEDVKYICDKIMDIVRDSMKGLSSTAYATLRNLLIGTRGKKPKEPKIDWKSVLAPIEPGYNFYRIRRMDYVYEIKRKELFHIPFNMRGLVKTQRYSTPGYPCLYLGESIYGCWEEMRRPPMYAPAVSRFVNMNKVWFLNLTIPSVDQIKETRFLKLLPLIIACMVRVAHDDHTYKPEYIVSQLLIEWVLRQRAYFKKNGYDVHGVMYTSTHRGTDFDFPVEKAINYAIPVFNINKTSGYCKELSNCYHLTAPTTNEIQQLRERYGEVWRTLSMEDGHPVIKPDKYGVSDFGMLENRLLTQETRKCED